jgi:hypothetical protein
VQRPGLVGVKRGVEPARPHRIRTTALESGRFSPMLFLRFLPFSIQVRTPFPEEETISTDFLLFPHLLAAKSSFLPMWQLIY